MAQAFANSRSILWLAAVYFLVIGFMTAALVLPTTSSAASVGKPTTQVSKMQNATPPAAQKMRLDMGHSARLIETGRS